MEPIHTVFSESRKRSSSFQLSFGVLFELLQALTRRNVYSCSRRGAFMADVGPILPYYLRSIRNIDFSSGNVLGVNYIHGLLSIITFIVLLFLALLIIRARPKSPENRFMFVLLLAEAYRVMANWYNIYPFNGSEGFLQWMSYYRVGWYFCSIMCCYF